MSKLTVVTDAKGGIAVIGHGHIGLRSGAKGTAKGTVRTGVFALPGQTLHEIEIKEDAASLKSFDQLREAVQPHLPAGR